MTMPFVCIEGMLYTLTHHESHTIRPAKSKWAYICYKSIRPMGYFGCYSEVIDLNFN
jgi:hypothetical protein